MLKAEPKHLFHDWWGASFQETYRDRGSSAK